FSERVHTPPASFISKNEGMAELHAIKYRNERPRGESMAQVGRFEGIGAARADHRGTAEAPVAANRRHRINHARLPHMILCARYGMIFPIMRACRTYGL